MLRSDHRTRRFDWRRAVLEAELPPTTKLVAFVLSMHMSRAGDSCFPGLALLRQQTGLSRSAVQDHLVSLIDLGWLAREEDPGRPTTYLACFPAKVVAEIVSEATAENPPARRAGTPPAEQARQSDTPARGEGATRPRPARQEGATSKDGVREYEEDVESALSRTSEKPQSEGAVTRGMAHIAEALADEDPAAREWLEKRKAAQA